MTVDFSPSSVLPNLSILLPDDIWEDLRTSVNFVVEPHRKRRFWVILVTVGFSLVSLYNYVEKIVLLCTVLFDTLSLLALVLQAFRRIGKNVKASYTFPCK